MSFEDLFLTLQARGRWGRGNKQVGWPTSPIEVEHRVIKQKRKNSLFTTWC